MAKLNGFTAALSSALTSTLSSTLLAALLLMSSGGLMGCGGSKSTPPAYPVPESRPIEETSLAPYLEDDEFDMDGFDSYEQDEEEAIEEEQEERDE